MRRNGIFVRLATPQCMLGSEGIGEHSLHKSLNNSRGLLFALSKMKSIVQPENIFLREDSRLVIGDFGVASLQDADQRLESIEGADGNNTSGVGQGKERAEGGRTAGKGTEDYMAPEQVTAFVHVFTSLILNLFIGFNCYQLRLFCRNFALFWVERNIHMYRCCRCQFRVDWLKS